VLVGGLFGLPADFCLALSLIKRARDIAVGLPALALWQVLEGRRLLTIPKADAPLTAAELAAQKRNDAD